MKKKVLLILFIMFTSFIGVLNVKAEVLIKSFRCYYNIKNEQNIQLGTMQVEINNYNDGNGSYTYEVIHKKENGDMGKYKGGTTTDYYNYDLNNGRYLSMFCGKTVACSKINETEIKKFVDYYKSNGTCSNLYYNLDGDSQARIETEAKDVNSNVPMVSYTTMFKGPNDSKWISQAEFEKRRDDNKQTAEGKDMICKYRMKFDLITGMFDVVFSKKVNKNTGNITYSITINGVETPINSLSETIFVPIGGFSGATVKYSQMI